MPCSSRITWSRPLVNSTVNAVRAMYSSLSYVCVQIKHRKRKGDRRIVRFVSFPSGNRVDGPGAAKTKRIRPARPSRSSRDWRRSAIHRGCGKTRVPRQVSKYQNGSGPHSEPLLPIQRDVELKVASQRHSIEFSHSLHPLQTSIGGVLRAGA